MRYQSVKTDFEVATKTATAIELMVLAMLQEIEGTEPLMEPKEVKRLLRCSLPWVYKAAGQGLIPCVRIPCSGKGHRRPRHLIRFKRTDILDFIERHYQRT